MTQNELSQSKRMHKQHKELAQHRVNHTFTSHVYQSVIEALDNAEVPYQLTSKGGKHTISVDGNHAAVLNDLAKVK